MPKPNPLLKKPKRKRLIRKPRLNQIEKHPERLAIEIARVAGVPFQKVADKYGIDRTALIRHMSKLPGEYMAQLVAEVPRDEIVRRAAEESGNLLDHAKMVRNLTERQLIAAQACGDSHATAKLSMAARGANEFVATLTGEIKRAMPPGITINNAINVQQTPAWRELTKGLIEIAGRHPEAKADIRALIMRLEQAVEPTSPASAPAMIEGSLAHAA